MRKYLIQLLFTFRFSVLAYLIFPVLIIILFLLVPKLNKHIQPLTQKEWILLSISLTLVPVCFWVLTVLLRDRNNYWKLANEKSPVFDTNSILSLLLFIFCVLTIMTISVLFIKSFYKTQTVRNELYRILMSLLYIGFLVTILIITPVLNCDRVNRSLFFFYDLRSNRIQTVQELRKKVEFFLCNRIRLDRKGTFITKKSTREFLEQWNGTFKDKLDIRTFNQKFSGICPMGAKGQGNPIPLMKQQTANQMQISHK